MMFAALEDGLQLIVHLGERCRAFAERLVLDEAQSRQQRIRIGLQILITHAHEYSSLGTRSP